MDGQSVPFAGIGLPRKQAIMFTVVGIADIEPIVEGQRRRNDQEA